MFDGVSKLRKKVDGIRAEITRTRAERDALMRAPATRAEALARLDEWIAAQAAQWGASAKPFVAPQWRGGPSPGALLDVGDARSPFLGEHVTPLVCAVFRDAVRDALVERIDAALAGHESVAANERAARLAELDGRILALEREEESLIESAEQVDIAIERRGDADPRAVLGLTD